LPHGAANETVLVRVSTGGVVNALPSTTSVTFLALPEVDLVSPPEGPVEGGTQVQVSGRHFHMQAPEGKSQKMSAIPMQCVFGTKESRALVLSDKEIFCTAPAADRTYFSSGHLAAFSVRPLPRHPAPSQEATVATPGPKLQTTFFYRKFEARFASVEPLSGPEFGGTLVSFRS